MSSTSSTVASALDSMSTREDGLYGAFENLPAISQAGHNRRCELLDRLNIGDVRSKAVVDFGMGAWAFGAVYPKLHNCARAIGMDISPAAIEVSKKIVADSQPAYASHFETYQSDGMQLPLPDNSVDLFFSGESIEHIRFPPQFLSEIYRILKDDGQLVVTTPNREAIKYKEIGEEYCTSPEHFWLFNHKELVDMLQEFFVIEEQYGFNGTFGSHEEDREIKDMAAAVEWSRKFENEPHLASGMVMRLKKKSGVDFHYQVTDIGADSTTITGCDTYLPLEFGLKGLAMDNKGQSVAIRRPASDGFVMRCWCHRWSGIAHVTRHGVRQDFDLYAYVPGWRQWRSDDATSADETITIRPSETRNSRALANQVIYFEAFTWDRLRREDNKRVAPPAVASPQALQGFQEVQDSFLAENLEQPAAQLPLPPLHRAGYGFGRYQVFVTTSVFLWFSPTEGNLSGPWPPLGGRSSWTGKKAFWVEQIKDMMVANIDAIYLHCIDLFQEQRVEFFKAYAELRSLGWDVPKIAPFLDPFGLWRESPIDVATEAGKDEFTRPYIEFYRQYFEHNTDPHAASYLLTVDGRLTITTWWVFSLLRNLENFRREDVASRLARAFGKKLPQLDIGLYVASTSLIDPDLPFTDERMVMFSGYSYALHSVHQGVDVWHVQAGYWDQNIRTPGYFLPRNGGQNYRLAWEAVVSNMPNLHRVYVESWNEYDEGSGIYAADPNGLFVNPAMHSNSDSFSDTNDPYEYILTTWRGASRVNGRKDLAASVLFGSGKTSADPDKTDVAVVVVNEGNARWANGQGYALQVQAASGDVIARVELRDGAPANAGSERGIARGQATIFTARLANESVRGQGVTVTMTKDAEAFSAPLQLNIEPIKGRA